MTPTRRRLLLALGGAGAAAAGAAGFAWHERRFEQETGGVWTLRLPSPDGSELDFAAWRGRPLLLNFWATWCAPCIREMPQIDRFHAEAAPHGWQVVGLAADAGEPVRAFLQRTPVRYPIALAGAAGITMARRLGNADGALPYTVLFGRDGRVRRRKLGEIGHAELSTWLLQA